MANANLVHVVFDRTAQAPNEDVALFTMHIRGILPAAPDSLDNISDSERSAFTANIKTFYNAIKVVISDKVMLSQIRYYDMKADALTDMGPPAKIDNWGMPGDALGQVLPPQLALSVTFKHPSSGGVGRINSRWGRIYIPGLTTAALASNGRISSSTCDLVAAAAQNLMAPAGGTDGVRPTIWSRKAWQHFDPKTVQVDDVPDVIRSRRFSAPTYRKALPIS